MEHYFDAIKKWQVIAGQEGVKSYVVYGGTQSMISARENLLTWCEAGSLNERIRN